MKVVVLFEVLLLAIFSLEAVNATEQWRRKKPLGFVAPRSKRQARVHISTEKQATTTAVLEDSAAKSYTLFEAADLPLRLKAQVLQLGAALDRGQAYNPTSGDYYKDRMDIARGKVQELIESFKGPLPTSLEDIQGEWELVFTTVPHGIFRSSPFFLAVQESFTFAENTTAFGEVIPIIGWFKLLPTFGGCVITASKAKVSDGGVVDMEVDYTTSKPVPGLQGLGKWIWSVKVPVGAVWKLLPWNKGRAPTCSVTHVYLDNDMRIVQDLDGELFVYSRPVDARP